MKPRTKKPRKLHILLKELNERRVLQLLFYYLIGTVGLLGSVYELSEVVKIRIIVLILCITGIPIVIIFSYFHGKKGKNPIPIIEIILISICVFIGVGFTARILMEPTPLTILVRMMRPQENWFIENIIKEFEKENHCNVIIKRFGND